MANATFAQINTAIHAILETLDGVGNPLQVVYAYPEPKPSGFPCAFPMLKGAVEDDLDTQVNELAIDFIVRVIMEDTNDQAAYDLLLDVVQLVLAEFRKVFFDFMTPFSTSNLATMQLSFLPESFPAGNKAKIRLEAHRSRKPASISSGNTARSKWPWRWSTACSTSGERETRDVSR